MLSLDLQTAQLLSIIRDIHTRGWSDATSTNYSFRHPNREVISISRSGVDKAIFEAADLIEMHLDGTLLPGFQHSKPSAETALHLFLYSLGGVGAILHSHSVDVTVYSLLHAEADSLDFSGFEMQKALADVDHPDTTVTLPLFDNDQDMERLRLELARRFSERPPVHGFILKGHGLYAWGSNLSEAKRHLQAYEFLVTCALKLHIHHR